MTDVCTCDDACCLETCACEEGTNEDAALETEELPVEGADRDPKNDEVTE